MSTSLNDIGSILDRMRARGYERNFFRFAAALKETHPELNYTEYKNIAREQSRRMGWFSGFFQFIPFEFEWFAKSFISAVKPEKVLVPFATGLECDFFSSDTSVEYHFFNKDNEKATGLFADIHTIDELPKMGEYSLIVSALPLMPINSKSLSSQIVEQCADLLSRDGYCIFTFPRAITLNSSQKWLSSLVEKDLFCDAVIDMPMEAYAPIEQVNTEIVIFTRRKPEKRFVGLISEENFAQKIVDNYLNKRVSVGSEKLGIYVEGKTKSYSDYVNNTRLQNKYKSISKAYNGRLEKVRDLGIIHAYNRNKRFQDVDNAVYVPKLGRSLVVTALSELMIKEQNYFQIVLDPNKILPRFFAFFLNTEEGLNIRQLSYKGETIKAFNSTVLGEVSVPCPSIELQAEYLKTYDRLEVLRVEVETLKNRLCKIPASYKNIRKEIKDINNTGDRFSQWIESLPYPIATILKRYSVAEDVNKKQETLFYFFEAYAIFEATLLSAALNKNLIDYTKNDEANVSYFEKATFGSWVWLDRYLSNLFSKVVNSQDDEKKKSVFACFKTTDENLIKLLCNKNVCNVLEQASNHRNNWKGHSGITSEALYNEHVDVLDNLLHKIQDNVKDLYERVRLIRAVSLEYSKNIFSNKVEVLTGSNPIFAKDTIDSLVPLEKDKLYIQMIDTGEMLKLPPYFILKNSPVDVKNACYFYSRVESGNTKYVSYHYEGRPENIETGEDAFDFIKQILTS